MHAPRRTAAVAASLLGLTLTTTGLPAAGNPTTSTSTGSPTATAAAGPSCTLQVNEVVRVDRPVQLINAYLAQDCADAGTDSATWEIRHRVRDLVGDFHFPSSSTSTPSGWTITDSTPLGEYDVVPGGAYDQDTADGLTFIPQNTKQLSVRLRSWLTLGADASASTSSCTDSRPAGRDPRKHACRGGSTRCGSGSARASSVNCTRCGSGRRTTPAASRSGCTHPRCAAGPRAPTTDRTHGAPGTSATPVTGSPDTRDPRHRWPNGSRRWRNYGSPSERTIDP